MKRASICLGAILWALAACNSSEKTETAGGEVVSLTDVDVTDYDLDMDKMRRFLAGMDALTAEAQRDSGVAHALASNGNETTRQTITRLEGNPRVRDILDKSGLSPSDYVMTMTAYLQAAMVDAAERASPNGKAPENVNRKNVEFLREHRAELEPLLKRAGLPT